MGIFFFLIFFCLSSMLYGDVYSVIDEQTNKCVNIVEWDGVTTWSPPNGTFVIQNIEIQRKDEVEKVNGVWKEKLIKTPKDNTTDSATILEN